MLRALAAIAGAAAVPAGLGAGRAGAAMPLLPPDIGRGRNVVAVGAGVAGLTAGMVLARHGFKVTILEADGRYGGRSLTPRPIRPDYRDWWFDKYNPDRLFAGMYVSEYRVDPARSPDAAPQVCRFDDPLTAGQVGAARADGMRRRRRAMGRGSGHAPLGSPKCA